MPSFKIPTYIFSSTILCLTMFSYHSAVANQNVIIDLNKPISAVLLAQYNRDGIEIDYDDTTVLKKVFVTDDNGAIARQLPSGAARKVKSYTFGEKLEVIEDRGDWYAVRDKIYREYDENGDGVVETNIVKWEKVFVKKDHTGAIRKTILTPDELNIITYLLADGKDERFEKGKALKTYLKFELIDKSLFEKKRPLAVNFLSKDKMIKKQKGVLSIPTTKKVVKLIDIDTDDDSRASFEYIGQINALNQHLIFGQFWEISGYTMIDKTNGEETQSIIGFPYLSPNKKYIIAVYADPYGEQHADLELYRIENKQIVPILNAEFKNWMPATEPEDIFWARDGYLYLAVTHSLNFWKEDGLLNDKFRYIRIKVAL
ncbi:hypothetical protein [Psychrobacter sp. TB55-MNA-CIBAN-0194]|uniref:hypothetical protein n=1 Tax=Psychrobacter sp. TB55-MNA-CIBAN-0194 TaxID=3140445 RepID=UPI00332A8960